VHRVSVRSFRAEDLAERELKDLARNWIDTTWEVVGDAARNAILPGSATDLRTDPRRSSDYHLPVRKAKAAVTSTSPDAHGASLLRRIRHFHSRSVADTCVL
jgi:hypothetical protein